VKVNSVTPVISTTTAGDGTYTLTGVPVGTRTINASLTNYVAANSGNITVTQGTTAPAGTLALNRTTVSVSGTVTDGTSGASVSGATVSVQEQSGKTATTNSSGFYTISGVWWGSIHLVATAADYTAKTVPVTLSADTNASQNFALTRTTTTISGIARDVETDDPIEGATLTVEEQPGLSTTTNTSGEYSLAGVYWGTIQLTATSPSYTAQTQQVDVAPSGLAYDFYLEIGRGTITGVVADSTTQTGLSGATVALEDDEGHATGTDWMGTFTITDVRAGVHNLVVSRGSHVTVVTGGVEVVPNETVTAPQVELIPHTATISGRAFDPDTGQSVAGVTVTCARGGQVATTDGAGNFSLSGIAPGWEALAFTKDGRWPFARGEIAVNPGEALQIDGEMLSVSGTSALGLVHGRVVDSHGLPVGGATVAVVGSGSTTTASDGTYSIQLTRGRYVFTAGKAGYRTVVSRAHGNGTFYFPYNFQILQDFVLYFESETGTINLTTTDPITLATREGGTNVHTLGSKYELDSGPTGARTITDVPPGLFLGWVRPRTLAAGQTLSLDMHGPADSPATSPSWAIGGLAFRSTTFEPVAGARVTLSNPGQGFTTTVTTNANGRWSFASGPTGDYTVAASADGGLVSNETWSFTAQDDGAVFLADPEMAGATDGGTLTIDQPAEGATLSRPPSSVTCSAVLPRPGDYIISAEVQLSGGDVTDSVLTFQPDGGHFSISFASSAPDGQHTLSVNALTARDAILTASVTVNLQQTASVAALAVNPSSVAGGSPATGTVTLDRPAPAGGTMVALTSSDPGVASVPPTVTVPETATSAQFTVATSPVSSATQVTISAIANGTTKTAQLTVDPIGVASLALSPASVVGGQASTATVTLNSAAPAGGLTVSLTSSDPAVATVPGVVTVLDAATSAQFTVTTSPVSSATQVTISATASGATKTATLTVGPLGLQSLTLNPTSVYGGYTSAGTVTLNGPAPAGGLTVSLSSSDPTVVTVPASVTVAQGATSTSFTATTSSPDTTKAVVISAVAGGDIRTATLTVRPIGVYQFSLAYAKAGSEATVTGTVFLNAGAPTGGTVVSLTSDNPGAASVPASITVPGGRSYTDIVVTTYAVASPTVVTISASAGGTTRNATLTVGPVEPTEVKLIPTSLAAGLTSQSNRVELDGVAGTGGVTVSLTSSHANVSVPATVTVPMGAARADFTLSTWEAVCTAVPVIITATHGSVAKTANFTLVPASLSNVFLSTPTMVAGNSATAYVDLSGWENRESCPTAVSSSDPTVAFVPSGLGPCQPVGSFQRCQVDVTTSAAAPPGATVTISATLQGHTDSTILTIAAPAISGVAPGLALPGDTVVVYGPTFAQKTTVMIQGPYQSSDPFGFSPSCKLPGDVCPTTDLPATVNTDGTVVSFAVPSDLQDGAYHLWTKTPSGTLSNVNRWVIVDTAAKTRAVVPPEQHHLASRIYPGQTITGTLTGDNAAGGVADYNFFYFVGTAGSRINVSMERVDVSKPWEHPNSLDPQIEIVGPDGFLPQNLVAWDNQPGVDLNASLHDAVLPLTGLYVIAAETTRGHGDYRLAFSSSSMAPPAEGERVFALSGADRTVPVGSSFETVALTLDPRGYPISGATLAYAAQSSPDNQGAVGFVGGAYALSNPDGSSFKDVVFASAGKAEFGPSFIATFSSEPLAAPENRPQAVRVRGPIPRYQPVAHLATSVGSLRPDGTIALRIGSFQRLPIERRHARKEVRGPGASGPATGHRSGQAGRGSPSATLLRSQPGATGLGALDSGIEPVDASTAIPLPEQSREMIARAQGITSCTAATYAAAGTTAAQVNPPYTVTLTDLTPSTGQSEPNGEVGVDGIHGHRVEKVIRLRIQIRDQYDVEPTYPVLVHLTAGGPHHGTLILDPDGARTECSNASFLWHERDAQGNLVALNEEFEYRMGTWSRYVGVEPDPNNPPQVRPVWGVAEDLEVRLQTPDGAPLSYTVHPEPGKPDHFACWEGPNLPCGDVFAHWTGIFSGMTLTDAYHLEDGWGNATFGYTDTAATQPGSGVSVQFTDQTVGTGGDFAGYTLASQWPTNPAPSGQLSSTLSMEYPDDPAGDWAAGTVTKTITYDFEGGSSHLLIQKQNYDARFGVDESAWPMTVAPGAGEGAMPTTASGDTPRLVLLALSGSNIPSRIPAGPYYSIVGQDEPSLDSTHVYRNTDGSWNWVPATDQDVALEIDGGGEFRLSLVDGSGTVVPGTAFRVHRCPRGEHLTAESPPGDCTLGPVDSEKDGQGRDTGVLSSHTLNEAGGQRGYLGIELTTAPVNPGQYFILVESIGSTPYRIRWESQLIGRSTPEEDLKGGFVICTVLGGEILDENFQRIEQLQVAAPKIVYVRYTLPNESASQIPADLQTTDSDNATVASVPSVGLGRLGASSVFLSGPVTVEPNQDEMPAGAATLRARAMDLPGASIRAADGSGHLDATTANLAASVATLSGLVYDFRIGTLQDWQEPNLLFGNGEDYTVMSVRITDATGNSVLPSGTALEIEAASEADGTVSGVASAPDSEGRWSFRYTAPSLPLGVPNFVVRPRFNLTSRLPGGQTIYSYAQTSKPIDERWGGCLLFKSDSSASEQFRHCFGDPNFPIVYARLDFRRLVLYDPPSDPVTLSDEDYVNVDLTEGDIQTLIEDQNSWLAHLWFVGDLGQFDTTNPDGVGQGRADVYGGDPYLWPIAFLDRADGSGQFDGVFNATRDAYIVPPAPGYVIPPEGSQGVRFSNVLAHWCDLELVNPKLLIAQLQKEKGTFRGDTADTSRWSTQPGAGDLAGQSFLTPSGAIRLDRVLKSLLGVENPTDPAGNVEWPHLQLARGVARMRDLFIEAEAHGLPVVPFVPPPTHSGRLFPVKEPYDGACDKQPDPNYRIFLQNNVCMPVAFYTHSRGAYSLFRYTPAVRTQGDDGGVLLLLKLWKQYGFND
jgi:hypothetical protein